MELIERITQLLNEKFASDADYADCFVVEITLDTKNLLEVFVDSDGPMDFARCQRLSRFLEGHLDENKWLGEEYILEVSSPGIGRPLKFTRQYIKNVGRTLEITLADDTKEIGVLLKADENELVIEQKKRIEEGKKKKNVVVETAFEYSKIKQTIVMVVF
jgi:ribosome maturation factor RimP